MGGQKKIVNFQKMDTLKKTRLKKRRIRKINITKTCHKKNGHNEKILHFLKMGVRKKKTDGRAHRFVEKKNPPPSLYAYCFTNSELFRIQSNSRKSIIPTFLLFLFHEQVGS